MWNTITLQNTAVLLPVSDNASVCELCAKFYVTNKLIWREQ